MHDGSTRARFPTKIVHYRKARVSVTRGPDRGSDLEIAGGSVRIGTDPQNDLVLRDDSVSRWHCEVELTADGVRVRDRGSTNGTFAGKMRVFDAALPGVISLQLGDSEVTVTPLEEVAACEQIDADRFVDVLGRAPRMRELFAALQRVAASDVTVLLEGETGTGKDVIAESIHRVSDRREGPFVVFDCSAVPASLIESELFGHERGAFTGAVRARTGVFEQAHRGTLFLDEIGELPTELQPRLLRVLEKREVRPVGGSKVRSVDVRVLAATNRNLRAEVQHGTFRQDLYFRLAGARLLVPPLRDRIEDIPMLVEHFLALEGAPISANAIPDHVWALFSSYRWPGNVRELRNAIRAAAQAGGDARLLEPDHLPEAVRRATPSLEAEHLRRVLASTATLDEAATVLGIDPSTLYRKRRRFGL